MAVVADRIGLREKLILSGLYLSKFDTLGLKRLGFESFIEAFNVIGYALGAKPASIKNYRDELDPLFPNARQGWHKRPTRQYCLEIFEKYHALDIESFTGLLKSFIGYDEDAASIADTEETKVDSESLFAKRLTTGLAAEHYFEAIQPQLSEFKNYSVENTTRWGCGYDFRLSSSGASDFLAIEVKGLTERAGSLSLTPKEHEVALSLSDRFVLFVVKNFRESPYHDIYRNPLSGALKFSRRERVVVQVAWLTTV
jgi:hypothetical protein